MNHQNDFGRTRERIIITPAHTAISPHMFKPFRRITTPPRKHTLYSIVGEASDYDGILFYVPRFLLGSKLVEEPIRGITALADLPFFQCGAHGTVGLIYMRAVVEAAFANEGPELRKIILQLFLADRLDHLYTE